MVANPPTATDSDLLRRYASQQDEGAFAELVRRHEAMVMGVAIRRAGDADLARDVTQQVFVHLARKAVRLLSHGRVAGWLYQAASFEAAKMRRSEERRQSRHAALAHLAPGEGACQEQWQALEEAMAALGDAEREVIVMHYFEDRSYPDMAAAAALSEAAVRKRVSRALGCLSRQLQRRGQAASAVGLLTTAVAMQTSVPLQASLTTSALAAAGQLQTAAWLPWTALMTTNTALKTAAAVTLLAAVPVVWQANDNAGLRAEVARLRPVSPAAAPAPAARPGEDPNEAAQLAAAQSRLTALRGEHAAEAAHLAGLQTQAAKLKNEVVVSLGRIDEVAAKVAELQLMALEVERLEGQKEAQEKLLPKLMDRLAEMMPLMAEIHRLSADPKMNARMVATTTAKIAGVSDSVRDEMERRLLRHYQRMRDNGLTLDRRPADNRADWDRRYGEAAAAAMRDLENLVPAAVRLSPLWKSETSADPAGHFEFLDAMFGSSPPAAKAQP